MKSSKKKYSLNYEGSVYTVAELSRKLGIPADRIYCRIRRGITDVEQLIAPPDPKKAHTKRSIEERIPKNPIQYGYPCCYLSRNPSKRAANYRDRDYNSYLMRTYGITMEDVDRMLSEQEHKCAVCLSDFTETPCVDHCHTNKHVRGLLCNKCNQALGLLGDSTDNLIRAIKYLE